VTISFEGVLSNATEDVVKGTIEIRDRITKEKLFRDVVTLKDPGGGGYSRHLNYDKWLSYIKEVSRQALPASAAVDCKNVRDQREANHCAELEYKNDDRELNRVYRQVMSQLKPESRRSLRDEQRIWIKERDAKCQALLEEERGGTAASASYYACMSGTTAKRTDALRTWRPR